MRISDWSSDVCSSDLRRCYWRICPSRMRATSVNNRSDRPAPSGCKVSRGDGKPMNKPKLNYWAYIPPMPAEEIARAVRDYSSEERRVGKECVSTCSSRWAPYHKKKKKEQIKRD